MEMFSMKAILIMVFILLFFYLVLEMCRYETAPIFGQGTDLDSDIHKRVVILDRLMTLRDEDLLHLKADLLSLEKALADGNPNPSANQSQNKASAASPAATAAHQGVSAAHVVRDIKRDIKRLQQNGSRPGDLKMARHRVLLIIILLFLMEI